MAVEVAVAPACGVGVGPLAGAVEVDGGSTRGSVPGSCNGSGVGVNVAVPSAKLVGVGVLVAARAVAVAL